MEWAKRKGGVIKQPNEFGCLLLAPKVLKARGVFYGWRIFSFNTVKEVSCRVVITACQIALAREIIWIFFPPHRVLRNKRHPSGLICLGRVPPGGGSTWTERALSPHWRIRGPGGGLRGDTVPLQFHPKCCNCLWARTGQSNNAHFPLHSLSLLYLLIFVSKWKKIKVFKGPLSCGEWFLTVHFTLTRLC